ncbi:MAG: substrate-binding domain-containing protein, partial [Oscillospiraceae bacterium]
GANKITSIRFVQFKAGGQIVDDTPFFAQLYQGIEAECQEQGYEMLITTLQRDSENFNMLLSQILNNASCGVIFLATEMTQEDMTLLENSAAPLLMLDNWPEKANCSALLIANTDSTCHAVEHLIENGHTKIGYLKCTERIKNFFYRQEGYLRAHALHGLQVQGKYDVMLPPGTSAAWKAMEEYLDTNPELPTAFFADNDNIALGALKAFEARGINVPKDISVVGFDNLPFAEFCNPPLSTVHVPKYEMGRMAVRMLLDSVNSRLDIKIKAQICTAFIKRNSVINLKRNDEV